MSAGQENWNEYVMFEKGIYLEQRIEDVLVFEVLDKDNEIDNIFVKVEGRDYVAENYYYRVNSVRSSEPVAPYLPYEGNEWLYESLGLKDKYIHIEFDVDIEKTQQVKRDSVELLRKLKLRNLFINDLYKCLVKENAGEYKCDMKVRKEVVKRCNGCYDEYKKFISGHDDGDEKLRNMSRREWVKELYKCLKEIISSDDKTNKRFVALKKYNINIADMSYFLSFMDAKRFVIYKENFFKMIGRLYGGKNGFAKKTCRGEDFLKNVECYLEYDDVLMELIKKMFGNEWEEKVCGLTRFVENYSVEEFLWKGALRE